MTPAKFRWGLLLIMVGTLLLLDNLEIVDSNFHWSLVVFFPFVLIAIGIEKIFTGSKLQFISYLSSLALVGGVIFLALEGNSAPNRYDFFHETEYVEEFDPNIQKISAVINLYEDDLTIRDATEDIVFGRFREFTGKPDISYAIDNGHATIEFEKKSSRGFGGFIQINTDNPDDWKVSFCEEIPLYLQCFGEDSHIHLNLSTTPLRDLLLDVDGAEIYIKIGDLLPQVKLSIKGNDSKLRLRIPRDAGIIIDGDEHENLLERIGLSRREDGRFVNAGYDTLLNKVEVDLDDRFRSLSIDFY